MPSTLYTFKEMLERYTEDSKHSGFQNLMKRRVREILLVSSPYDSFVLAEDGKLHELILSEFVERNLNYAPGMKRVGGAEEALALAEQSDRFNLIIATENIEGMDVEAFARKARAKGVKTPIVLLTYDNRELPELAGGGLFDYIFNWQGDFSLFLTIVKLVEDRLNADDDVSHVGVQAVLLVEDSVRFYSAYLPVMYKELIEQSQRVIAEGPNMSIKLMRMRARPKILLATNYEEAVSLFEKYRDNLLGVVSDVRYPKGGELDSFAGIDFTRLVKSQIPDLPVLLQSTNADNRALAHSVGASFAHKNSPTLLHELSAFIFDRFAFGDFVFKTPQGEEVWRARDLKSFEEGLAAIPLESLLYHATRNHFSTWLKARTEFDLASKLKPKKAEDFRGGEEIRAYLVETIRESRRGRYRGIIVDYNPEDFETNSNIARIGEGSIGGKARGAAFVSMALNKYGIRGNFKGVRIFVPSTVVLCTGVFDDFMTENDLWDFALTCADDGEISKRFQEAVLPESVVSQLRHFLSAARYPLAVRSSSILEDSLMQPFAGVYETYMIPNRGEDEERLKALCAAVKGVYASAYSSHAKAYIKATSYRLEEEKMAVIIQRVIGRENNGRFYPDFSGVARSHNSYPVPPMKSEDGVASVALGLGKAVVDGSSVVTFCPKNPALNMQAQTPEDLIENSQRYFYAINLDCSAEPHEEDGYRNPDKCFELLKLGLAEAEKDGTLAPLASTYSPDNEAVYDGISRQGIRLVSFAPLLKFKIFPLPQILSLLLEMGRYGMSCPVEIEFAVNMKPGGASDAEFAFLQMRPLALGREFYELDLDETSDDELICRSGMALGHGVIQGVRDVIIVDKNKFERGKSVDAAREVARFNAKMVAEKTPYVLIGVGRWGSADSWLGIPVKWDEISGAKAIIEAGFKDFKVTPSQGSHFFQNLTSFKIGYFTVNEWMGEGHIDWDWLLSVPPLEEGIYAKRLRFDEEILIKIDGRKNAGVVFKPRPK